MRGRARAAGSILVPMPKRLSPPSEHRGINSIPRGNCLNWEWVLNEPDKDARISLRTTWDYPS